MRAKSSATALNETGTGRRLLWGGALLALSLTLPFVSGCAKQGGETASTGGNASVSASGEEIPVGEFDGLTGGTAGFGQTSHNGMVLAVDEINAAGGVNGKKLHLYTEDDESQKEKVRNVVTKLITQQKVTAILGEVASSRSIAAAGVCEKYGVPMISPSSTNPAVTVKEDGTVRDYIFRVCFIDPFQGEAMARFLHDNLKLNHVAVFRNVKEDYSKGLADFFIKTFTANGGTITKDISYSTGDTDFRAQLTAIKASNPEAVFVPGYYTEVGLIAQQAKEVGLTVPLCGGDGWDDPSVAKNPAVEGDYFSDHIWVDSPEPKIKSFVDAYTKKFGMKPNALSALGYDAAKLLADAMKRAKSLNGADLKDAIAETKNFDGVSGNITIDAHHNALKPASILQFKGGKEIRAALIQPK
jgi:branched-chain amino acid transport system substrate-binding protein